jgi:hypothetical protein
LLGVSRARVSKVMSAYTNHGKRTSAKRNSGRKSTLTGKDCCALRNIVSKNHRTTVGQVTGQQNWTFILKILFPQKQSDVIFTNTTSLIGLQLLNFWLLLKVMFRCVNNGIMTIKPGHQTTGNACVIWSDESTVTLFPTSGRVYVWRTPVEAYNSEYLLPTVQHVETSVMVWAFCWSHYYPPWPNYCKGVCRQVGESHDPDVISEQRCSCPRRSWKCSVMIWRAWRWTSTTSLVHTFTSCEHHWSTLVSIGD